MQPPITKTDRQLLALQRAGKNPKYRAKVKAKIKGIKQRVAWNNFLSQ